MTRPTRPDGQKTEVTNTKKSKKKTPPPSPSITSRPPPEIDESMELSAATVIGLSIAKNTPIPANNGNPNRVETFNVLTHNEKTIKKNTPYTPNKLIPKSMTNIEKSSTPNKRPSNEMSTEHIENNHNSNSTNNQSEHDHNPITNANHPTYQMTHEQEGRNDDCTINTQTTNQTTETNNNYNISTANYSIQSTYTNSQKSIPINDDTLRITI